MGGMRVRAPALVLSVVAQAACGGSTAQSSTATGPSAVGPAAASATAMPAAPAWSNPGGMWLPSQMPELAGTLKELGLALLPSAFSDPQRAPLGAAVQVSGVVTCSAAFVSPDGLIATNHHCVLGALQHNSTPADDLAERGYYARTAADERWAGPREHAYVVVRISDVTHEMTDGLEALPSDLARHDASEQRAKGLLALCEKDHPELRCRIDAELGGARWELTAQLDIRDLRLVYAPPRGVGNFGGQTDNWMWPRHSGDFALLRAYVGGDGKPAEHAAGNRPYRSPLYLGMPSQPLKTGDLVLMAGFPGRTARLATAAETADAASWSLPRSVEVNQQERQALEHAVAGKKDLAIKAAVRLRSLDNLAKKNAGIVKTLVDDGLLVEKQRQDAELLAWIDADPARKARYRPGIDRLAELDDEARQTREADAALADLVRSSALLSQAMTIVRLADERARPDADRRRAYQDRNVPRFEQGSDALKQSYARELDQAVLRLFVERTLALPASDRPKGLAALLGAKPSAKAIDGALARLYGGTRLEDGAVRKGLLGTPRLAALQRSPDSFIRLALALLPDVKASEAASDARAGGRALALPVYIAARREHDGGRLAPDANGTLRVSFGHVTAPPDGGRAFTTLGELAAKATGQEPFDAPQSLLDALARKEGAAYNAAELNDVPVDFMSDLDITNGFSGSPTVNARGQLVGIAFDGSLATVASDWQYMRGQARALHVDVRFLLYQLDVIEHADRILDELGVKRGH
jgi:hypothetical protein